MKSPTVSRIVTVLAALFFSHTVGAITILHTAEYNNHTYHLLGRTNTWQESEDFAQSLGGHLVTINDQAENNWILNTFGGVALSDLASDLGGVSGIPSIWLGLIRTPDNNSWHWVSGEAVTYTHWASGEPRNTPNETTSGLLLSNPYWPNGYWHDIYDPRASHDYDYGLVEVASIPDSGTTLAMLVFGMFGVMALRFQIHGASRKN